MTRSDPDLLPLYAGLLAVLLPALTVTTALSTATPPGTDAGGDCMPAIAAKCFDEVAKDLACQRGETLRNSSRCAGRDARDMCYTLEDALNCTSDIIDGDCSASGGRLTYDDWLRGLRSAQSHLCENGATNMNALIRQTPCWDPAQYLACVERDASVYQPADLMKVELDAATCSALQRASSHCISGATSPRCGPASTPSAALHAALGAFLLETPCRATCWQGQPARQDRLGGGVILAIVLLAVLSVALAAALGFVTYRTSCFRIPMARG